MAHSKTIQFYRNNTVIRPDTANNKSALTVAKEALDTSGSKVDGEMTLVRYKEGDSDPIKTLVGVYHKNGNTGTWSYLKEDHPYIPFGACDSTSTATSFTVTVPGIDKLEDGVCCLVKNGVVTSASGFTLNVNGLGAKPIYSNMATGNDITPTSPKRESTIFNINYTMLFIYSSSIIDNGAWICYRGYDANTNTVGYQLRGNSHTLPVTGSVYRYRLLFTSADGTHFVPSNTSTSTSASTAKVVNQDAIDPFGEIVYYNSRTVLSADSTPETSSLWSQYAFALGYSFNRTGAALALDNPKPLYVKCARNLMVLQLLIVVPHTCSLCRVYQMGKFIFSWVSLFQKRQSSY